MREREREREKIKKKKDDYLLTCGIKQSIKVASLSSIHALLEWERGIREKKKEERGKRKQRREEKEERGKRRKREKEKEGYRG